MLGINQNQNLPSPPPCTPPYVDPNAPLPNNRSNFLISVLSVVAAKNSTDINNPYVKQRITDPYQRGELIKAELEKLMESGSTTLGNYTTSAGLKEGSDRFRSSLASWIAPGGKYSRGKKTNKRKHRRTRKH
jgi:hypothetical protein